MRQTGYFAIVVWQLLVAGGCSQSSYPTTDLEGTIRVKGVPATEGGITFVPLAAHHGRGAFAPLVDGRYKAEKVTLGPTRVTFQLTRETGRVTEAYGKKVPEVVSIVPPKYQAGLEIEVNAGDVERNFELDSN